MEADKVLMLDTNVFNDLLDGKLPAATVDGRQVIVTAIQRGELKQTPDSPRLEALLATFETVDPRHVLTASFAWDIDGAGLGQACWNDGTGRHEKMLARLKELDAMQKNKRKPRGANQEKDILIAETALKLGAVLVTGDVNLRSVMIEFGGQSIHATELISEAK